MASEDPMEIDNGMGKEGFVVLPPAMCVLTLLEKCQNVASADRFASQYWLRQSRLSFEEQEKVRGERLCKYHYNNPVRVASVELITTPPKRARLDPAATGDDRPERPPSSNKATVTMVNAGTQTEEDRKKSSRKLKSTSSRTNPPRGSCAGLNNPELEDFIHQIHGFVYLDKDGYVWGEKTLGEESFYSKRCEGDARPNATRCTDCHALFLACSNARSRFNTSERKGTKKFTPLASLKVSPYIRGLLEKFKEREKATPKPPPESDIPIGEDDIEVDVRPSKEVLFVCLLFFFPPIVFFFS